ncbi:MAG: hypothetical protein ACU85V_03685 [Gammaproteobacteria bacterium]
MSTSTIETYADVPAAPTPPVTPPPAGSGGGFSYRSLSSLLRVFGTGVLAAALSVFLFQGWQDGGDIYRFATLLGFSGLLTGAGFLSSHVIRENVGARLFLGIALVSSVVNFAVAGGLVYSAFGAGALPASVPGFAVWHAGDAAMALTAGAAALVLLGPVGWIGFRVLARPLAPRFARLFLLGNAALLVPLRDGNVIAPLIALLAVVVGREILRASAGQHGLATAEGRFARAVLALPVVVMAGRLLCLYAADAVVFTTLAALAYLGVRQLALTLEIGPRLRGLLERLALLPAVGVAWGVAYLVAAGPLADEWILPGFGFVLTGLLVEFGERSLLGARRFRRLAGLVLAGTMVLNLAALPGPGTALAALAVGLGVTVAGYSIEQKLVFAAGLAAALSGLGYQLWLATHYFALGSWSTLALLGTLAILAASLLERYGLSARARLGAWHERIGHWER